MAKKLNIVLVLRSGGRYGIDDVRLLAAQLRKYAGKLDISVYCLYDKINNPTTLFGIKFIPMMHPEWPGWWSKINLFSHDIVLRKIKPFLYMDLDTMLTGDYANLIPKNEEWFVTLEDFYMKKRLATGLMWIPDIERLHYIWTNMLYGVDSIMQKFRGDQEFLHSIAPASAFFQDYTKIISSFKPEPGRIPLKEKPEGKAVICFHGVPGIKEAAKKYNWINLLVKEAKI